MKDSTLRVSIAVAVLLGCLAVLATVAILTSLGGYVPDQRKLLFLVLTPLVAPMSQGAVKFFLPKHRKGKRTRAAAQPESNAASGEIIFGLGVVIVFPLLLILMLLAKALNFGIKTFDDLITGIALVDGLFAIIMTAAREHFFPEKS